MKTSHLLSSFMLLLMAAATQAATRVDLNRDWSFRVEAGTDGAGAGWSAKQPAGTVRVDVPHTWNRTGANYDYLGVGWYFQRFDMPKLPADAIAQLNFGGTFYKARVWLNGIEVGSHEGGYTSYSFDITPHLRDRNFLAVAIDNRPGMYTIPGFGARGAPDAWYDWWAYGGIVRDVWVDVHGPVRIANQFIRSQLDGTRAIVTNRVTIVSRGARSGTLRTTIESPSRHEVYSRQKTVKLEDGSNEVTLSTSLENIERWDLDHPNLYHMTAEFLDGDATVAAGARSARSIESASTEFGLREFAIRDRHLLVNSQRVRLTGMTRHADSPWEGLAETRGTLAHDWEDMKSLDMTLTRPVHYAPDPWVADFADRRGILLIPEIPIWQASEDQLSNPAYLVLAKRQMAELIAQYGNHPSVFAWSVLNESAAGTPGGIRFFREMRDYIKSLDPGRFVTFADDNLPKLERAEQSAANDADFLMMNQYFGAWHGPREGLGPALDKVDRLFPTKMVIISELGFPGTFAKNATEADAMRVSILREQMPILAQRDWIAGAILWCYQDYKSRRYYWPGQEQGYLEHGIVDPARQRKPSYFAWRELNEPAHLEAHWTRGADGQPAWFTVKFARRTPAELPYRALNDYRIDWQLIDAANKEFARGPGTAVKSKDASTDILQNVPPHAAKGPIRLVVKLIRPDGSLAMERVLASQ